MMTQQEVLSELQNNSEKKYNEFNSRLIRTGLQTLGVRIPFMRALAKRIVRSGGRKFLAVQKPFYYEEWMVRGFVIGELRGDCSEILAQVAEFVPTIDNWATCDTFCSSLRWLVSKERDAVWTMCQRNIQSNKEFEVRWGVVMMMSHFLTDQYIERVLEWMLKTKHKEYYIEMGVAWTLATALAKHRNPTMDTITSGELQLSVLRKTVSKCRDSFRISADDKQYLKEYLQSYKDK